MDKFKSEGPPPPVPVLVVTRETGMELVRLVETHPREVYMKVDQLSMRDVLERGGEGAGQLGSEFVAVTYLAMKGGIISSFSPSLLLLIIFLLLLLLLLFFTFFFSTSSPPFCMYMYIDIIHTYTYMYNLSRRAAGEGLGQEKDQFRLCLGPLPPAPSLPTLAAAGPL